MPDSMRGRKRACCSGTGVAHQVVHAKVLAGAPARTEHVVPVGQRLADEELRHQVEARPAERLGHRGAEQADFAHPAVLVRREPVLVVHAPQQRMVALPGIAPGHVVDLLVLLVETVVAQSIMVLRHSFPECQSSRCMRHLIAPPSWQTMCHRPEECSMPAHFLATLPNFLAYLGAAIVLLVVFVAIYLYVTPYDEIALIRSNNTAAAISLSGAVLGFAMPIANVIAHSDTLLDLAVWGVIAGIVQLLAWGVARVALPTLQGRHRRRPRRAGHLRRRAVDHRRPAQR
jgi:putative membrane protein